MNITWRDPDYGRLWLEHVVPHDEFMNEAMFKKWQQENI
jgi:hypothetical protein